MKKDTFSRDIDSAPRVKWYQKWWVILLLIFGIMALLMLLGFAGLVYFYKNNIEQGSFYDPDTGKIAQEISVAPSAIDDEHQEISIGDDPTLGSADALVTIVMFEDYQCEFCRQVQSNFKELRKEYGDAIQFVYRDFPLIGTHQHAEKAAEAAQCANDQGRYWEYHDILYANQSRLDEIALKQYAKTLGLNQVEFDSCLTTGKHEEEVLNDIRDALAYEVDATPTWFINGVRYRGILNYDTLKAIVDAEIKYGKN